MTGPVLAATRWPTNAHLIEDVARLGYLKPTDHVLDPTYGNGVWWKRWTPEALVVPPEGTDFTRLPYDPSTFDAVAFDPPYVATGGRSTTGMVDFAQRYGLTDAPRNPALLQRMIDVGLAECRRVVRWPQRRVTDGGVVLVKCQDYVSGGRLWLGTHHTITAALALDFEVVDRLERIGSPRPQPSGRTRECSVCLGAGAGPTGWPCVPCDATGRVGTVQQHARRNLSTLLVLRAV